MTDIVVTVPRERWNDWHAGLGGGDPAGHRRSLHIYGDRPPCSCGDLLYIVSHGRLRLVIEIESVQPLRGGWFLWGLVLKPATLPATFIQGFPKWRARWWEPRDEAPFPDWRIAYVGSVDGGQPYHSPRSSHMRSIGLGAPPAPLPMPALPHGKTPSEQGGSSA
jgi:hypothetical protein